MIRDHARTLRRQLNAKTSKTRRAVRIPSGIVSSAEGRAIAQAQCEKRKEREAAKKVTKAQKENEVSTNAQLRATAGRQGLYFTGTLASQKLLELKNIAWTLDLEESGTREILIERIKAHCSIDINAHLRNSEQYGPLFGHKVPVPRSSTVDSVMPVAQLPMWAMSPSPAVLPLQPPPGGINHNIDGIWAYPDAFLGRVALLAPPSPPQPEPAVNI
jgi:hypothetical protein